MLKGVKIIGFICMFFFFVGYVQSRINHKAEVEECRVRGVAWFKEIGAYPYLKSTGEDAEVQALQRCQRSLAAF